ncbi:hypothetical protein BH10PSE14_BH10PSE14_04460 [soil metagenome]
MGIARLAVAPELLPMVGFTLPGGVTIVGSYASETHVGLVVSGPGVPEAATEVTFINRLEHGKRSVEVCTLATRPVTAE